MDTTSNPIPFSPAPHLIDAIVADLGNAAASLDDIAARSHTTVEALAHWMTSPEIAARLTATDDSITWRTRLLASRTLPLVIATLAKVLQDYQATRPSPSGFAQNPLHAAIISHRARETARRAAMTFIRLCRLQAVGLPTVADAAAPANPAHRTTRPIAPSNPQPSAPTSASPVHNTNNIPQPIPAAAPASPTPSTHPTSEVPNSELLSDAALDSLLALVANFQPAIAQPASTENNSLGATGSSLPVQATSDVPSIRPPQQHRHSTSEPVTHDYELPTEHPELVPAGASHEEELSPSRGSWP